MDRLNLFAGAANRLIFASASYIIKVRIKVYFEKNFRNKLLDKAYNEMMNEARALATKRMVAEAEALGADGIVNIRYASAAVMQGAAEVIVYGTAVKFINK